MQITLRSYAKINLTLDVSGLREDGFHDIDSVVQVISLSDELAVTRARHGNIEVTVESGTAPVGRDNIIYCACEAFARQCPDFSGAEVVLRKRVPIQAGLGGGSGNAAAAIAGLNRVYEAGLSVEQTAAIAAEVGSDAALFVYGGTVRMRGRGEVIRPLPDAPEMHLVVVKPDVGVPTGWAYAELDRAVARASGHGSDAMEAAIASGDRAGMVDGLSNDFDSVVAGLIPEIAEAKRRMSDAGAAAVLMSGSGSAVFGVFDSAARAVSGAETLSEHYSNVYVCRTLPRAESALV